MMVLPSLFSCPCRDEYSYNLLIELELLFFFNAADQVLLKIKNFFHLINNFSLKF